MATRARSDSIRQAPVTPPGYPVRITWADNSQWFIAPKQKRSRETMRRIFDASIHLFSNQGYDATTQQEIAARAGVTVGSIYRRFPDKKALLYTLLEGFSKSRIAELNRMCEGKIWQNKTFDCIILFYVDLVFNAYRFDADMLRIMERRRLVDPVVSKLSADLSKHAVNTFGALLVPHCSVPLRKVKSQFSILHTIVQGFLIYRMMPDPALPDYGIPLSAPLLKESVRKFALNHMNLMTVAHQSAASVRSRKAIEVGLPAVNLQGDSGCS